MEKITSYEFIQNGKPCTSVADIQKLNGLLNTQEDQRVFKVNGGSAEIFMKKDAVIITSQGDRGIIINEYGTTIDGRVSLPQDPNKIKIGGFWALNDEVLTTVPSTTYTPIPMLKYVTPGAVKIIKDYISFLKTQ